VDISEQTWLWSDRFVYVTLTESGGTEEMFDVLGRIPDALDAESDVVEVVNFGAVGVNDGDELERWSIATRPVPDAGPETSSHCAFWVATIGDTTQFPALAADTDVDRAIDEVMSAAATEKAQERAAEAATRAESGELVVVPVTREKADADEAASPPRRDWSALKRSADDWGVFAENGAGIMLRRYEGYYTGLDRVLPDGTLHEVVPMLGTDPLLMRHIGGTILSKDGATVHWATNLEHDIYRCDIATGEVTKLLEDLPKINTIALLDDDHLMVKTDKDLRVHAGTTVGLKLVASDTTELGPARAWRGGKAIICGTVSEPELAIYGWAHGTLVRMAEITVEINCYSTEVGDDDDPRVFVGGEGVTYELKNLDTAYQKFEAWAREQADERAKATGLVAAIHMTAPSPGIQEGTYEARAACAWMCRGEIGFGFALTQEGGGYRVAASHEYGVREVTPAIVGPSFQWDWRFDHKGIVVVNEGAAHEVDLVLGTSKPLITGGVVERASYVRGGYVTIEAGELVLYARSGDDVREAGRLDLNGIEPDDLGVAENGDVVFVRMGEHTAFLAVDVAAGTFHAMGKLQLDDYFTAYVRGGQLYVQNTYEGSGSPVIRHHVTGLAEARAAAIAGGEALESLEMEALTEGTVFGWPDYDMTTYNAKSGDENDEDSEDEVSDDDDDDDDDDEDDEDSEDEDEDDEE